jgi:hypothetical protein
MPGKNDKTLGLPPVLPLPPPGSGVEMLPNLEIRPIGADPGLNQNLGTGGFNPASPNSLTDPVQSGTASSNPDIDMDVETRGTTMFVRERNGVIDLLIPISGFGVLVALSKAISGLMTGVDWFAPGWNPGLLGAPGKPSSGVGESASLSKSSSDTGESKTRFVNMFYPVAYGCELDYGMPTEILLAMSAVETGWGKHVPKGSNNYLGIVGKGPTGKSMAVNTVSYGPSGEKYDVKRLLAVFDDPAQCFRFGAHLIMRSSTYRAAQERWKAGDYQGFIRELCRIWTPDPTYADKVLRVSQEISLILGKSR